ncbi:serine/threonine-protein kinase [Neorhodopirellula lusitana]|uniref:serine/threonine-protein kinase n=1 Tax=Neorhodopirellula lusitana TaxID=445327 RepID=UPI00384B1E53
MSEFEYLGPYRIGKVIGRGGMGSVYEATHAKSGERVAVKLIAQHVADDPRFRRRFDAEVETLRRIRHPGIVRLIGYGEESGRLFYAMELVEGETLQQRIRDVKRMGWLPAVDIAIQICAALKHAHDIGVIHRDLKPANLLLTTANEVKLVDFGIAKLFGYGEQTVAGSVLGTADYMAPEQAGDGPITPRTDLYAVGSVMYAMMAGRSPFAGKKLTQVMESLQKDQAVPLELVNPDIPIEIAELVHQLLAKNPKDRPPTALSILKRLKATRAGLQRGQTTSVDSQQTRAGTVSTDGSESDTQRSHATTPSGSIQHDTDDTGIHNKRDEATPHGSLTIGSLVESDSNGTGAEAMGATLESRPDSPDESDDFVTNEAAARPTHFQSIDGDDRDSVFRGRQETTNPKVHFWIQAASIATMIAILAGGVYLFVKAIQVPSADAMYTDLKLADEEDDLSLNENRIDQFLIHYPDDPRIEQVRQWKDQVDLQQTLRRILAKARRAGGVERLEPAAQAFVKAMSLRDTSASVAQQRLLAWLDVFAPQTLDRETEIADPEDVSINLGGATTESPLEKTRRRMHKREVEQLAELAQKEIERLAATDMTEPTVDPRIVSLMERIETARTLPPAAQEKLLSGLIELYSNDAWAAPIVTTAQGMLDDR